MPAFPRFWGLVIASLGVTAHSALAFATLEHGRLIGSATARVDYDSNIFLSHSQVSDTIGTADANVAYVRDAGIVTLNSTAGLLALGFADHSDQNTADPYFNSKLGYAPSDKSTLRTELDYRRNSLANEYVNARTRSDDLTFGGTFEYLATEKLGLRALADYVTNDYVTRGYSDLAMYDLGLYGVHVYSPKLKLLAGATYVESWTTHRAFIGNSPASHDLRYAVGAEGELAPKITGNLNVGVSRRSFKHAGFSGSTDLYLASLVSWAAAEKTTWGVSANRTLSLTAADQSVKSFDVALQVQHVLAQKLSIDGRVGWAEANFQSYRRVQDRNDHGYTLRARLNYAVKENVSCDLSAGYRDNTSTFLVSSYDRLNIGAGVVVRF